MPLPSERASIWRQGLWTVAAEVAYRGATFALFTLAATQLLPHEVGRANVATLALTGAATFVAAGWSIAVQRMHSLHVPDGLCWLVAIMSAGAISTCVFVFAYPIATALGAPSAAELVRLIAPVLLLQQMSEVAQGVASRVGRLQAIGIGRILGVLIALGVSVGLLLAGAGAEVLVVFALVSWVVIAAWNLVVVHGLRMSLGDNGSRRILLAFVLPLLGTNALTLVVTNVDNFMVARALGPAALSIYTLSFGLMSLPAYLVGHSLSKVLLPRYMRLASESRRYARQYAVAQSLEMFPAFGLTVLAVGTFTVGALPLILDRNWDSVGMVTASLAVFTMARLLLGVAALGLYSTGRTGPTLAGSLVQLVIAVPATWLAARTLGTIGVGFAMSFAALGNLAYILVALDGEWRDGIRTLMRVLRRSRAFLIWAVLLTIVPSFWVEGAPAFYCAAGLLASYGAFRELREVVRGAEMEFVEA